MNTSSMRDTIISTYHLEDLPVEKQDAMIEQISGLIFQSVLLRVVPQMSEENQNGLEKLLETEATPEDLLDFLNRSVAGFPNIVAEEAENFKKENEAVMGETTGK